MPTTRTPPKPKHVCVYCASNAGVRPEYLEAAEETGRQIALRGWVLVYGGGGAGLMGTLANGALSAGGAVIGVMPHGLVQREVAHQELTSLRIVGTMHERKAMMSDLAEAFVTLPGGLGTLEEFFETWTWAQLGVHHKPVGLLDVAHYWQPLVRMLEHASAEGFVRGTVKEWLVVDDEPARLLDRLIDFEPPVVRRWLRPTEV